MAKTNRKHILIDGEHINLEEYRAIQSLKGKIKKQGDEARKLTTEAKSKAQLAYEAREKANKMVNEYFGWNDEE